jgi:porin
MSCVLRGCRRAASVSKLAFLGLTGVAAVLAAGAARAQDTGLPDPSIATSLPPGLADPGGVRSALASQGILFGVNYTSDVLGNVSGGVEQSTHYAGLLEVYTAIDLSKLIGWPGLAFHASGYQIHGTSISGENLGSLAAVSNIEAYPSTRLFELWFEQRLLDDRVAIRFGQLAVDGEFFIADGGGNFIGSTFGWTTISSDNIPVGGPIYPIATPGVRVSFDPNDNLKIMAGLWNGDPVGPCPDDLDPGQCNEHGLDFRLEDPPLLVIEGAYSYNREGSGLPGTVKIGGWRHFGDFDDLRRNDSGGLLASGGDPLQHDGNYGLYAVIDQMIYRGPGGEGVSIFGRVAGSPSDRNQIDVYAEGGVVFAGFVPSRPNDTFGVAFAYSGISDDASGFDQDSGLSVIRDHESVFEFSYIAEIVPGFTVQPDFQYFWNPGGNVPDPDDPTKAVEDAAVIGVRSTINY